MKSLELIWLRSRGHVHGLRDVALEDLAAKLGRDEVHEVTQLALEQASYGLRVSSDVVPAHELELWDLD